MISYVWLFLWLVPACSKLGHQITGLDDVGFPLQKALSLLLRRLSQAAVSSERLMKEQ